MRHDRRMTPSLDDTVRRCLDFLPYLRHGHHFSHVTAARLWGCPLRTVHGEPIHVTSTPPGRPPRRRDVVGHHTAGGGGVVRLGLPVTDAVSTWVALTGLLPVEELVVAANHLVLDPYQLDPRDIRPHVTMAELERALDGYSGRGAVAAASALLLVRQGAESRMETLLRLLIHRAGLPEPRVNIDVTDTDGRWLGRGDLEYPQWMTVVEYDGDLHRTDAAQYERDITRIDSFIEAGWRVVRVRKHGIFVDPAGTVARITRALARGGWRG